ncbi:hypothetical protein AMAG_08774 [Allomyces macrogynus ATCC 38327]|uniref:Uncharacterized protein n=1 Tax=Allomyces macrogynus (strain ATCC 38327) TaxID=578462 RepID=A0A0L0SMG0_ALLM3|nr:hypothetical protein AMAG_08774 [Allomyces macrogynus ATCC 38327]|eukprot:KNE63677.1 hypothetical protein AMAG_08774 [Allomyces macrogynus ATCC 38327]
MADTGNGAPGAAQIIRLLDANGTDLLDSVSGDYEDSFCLETFADLIKMHAALTIDQAKPKTVDPAGTIKSGEFVSLPPRPRCFILARVQTWDSKQPGRAYYSYYNAYHLNKILFQTQIYLKKKLIHRLHVLNPLTNTDIIGNVQYFMVQPKDAPAAAGPSNVVKSAAITPASPDVVAGNDPPKQPPALLAVDVERAAAVPSGIISAPTPSSRTTAATVFGRRRASGTQTPLPTPASASEPADWTINTQLVTELRDDDDRDAAEGEKPTKIRRKSRGLVVPSTVVAAAARRLSSAGRRLSVIVGGPNPMTVLAAIGDRSESAMPITGALDNSDAHEAHLASSRMRHRSSSARDASPPKIAAASRGRAMSLTPDTGSGSGIAGAANVEIVSKPPDKPLNINNHRSHTVKVTVPRGTITRFAVPVPEVEMERPPTPPRRRRGLSLSNSGHVDGDVWVKQLRTAVVRVQQQQQEQAIHEEPSASAMALDARAVAVDTYDAILVGTDNDYLESSKMRALFRDHAVTPDDVKLFEMPEYTGEEYVPDQSPTDADGHVHHHHGTLPVVVFDDEGAEMCAACYPTNEQLAVMSPTMRFVHKVKCHAMILAVGAVCVLFLVMLLQHGNQPTGPTARTSS